MYILGLNVFHADSSACLYKDDILITEMNDDKINYIKINEDDEKLYNPINFYYFNGYKIYKDIKL